MPARLRITRQLLAATLAAGAGSITLGCIDGASALGRTKPPAYALAPYVDMTQYPAPNLQVIKRQSGVRQTTLGFITAQGASSCVATWGGHASYPASGTGVYQLANVDSFKRAGGDAVPSFGGQAGAELASVCPSLSALQQAYAGVIAAYRPSRIDFDIEGSALNDQAATTLRSGAIAGLQRASAAQGRQLQVSFTLPVLPTGLPPDALGILRSAVAHGVKIALVNLMTMDYGAWAAPHPQGRMGTYAIKAARSASGQLRALFPRLTAAARMRKLGITPMIGINDVRTEIFTLSAARQLAGFARADHVGMLSMWQLERDRQCATPTTTAQTDCSGIAQRPYEFTRTLAP